MLHITPGLSPDSTSLLVVTGRLVIKIPSHIRRSRHPQSQVYLVVPKSAFSLISNLTSNRQFTFSIQNDRRLFTPRCRKMCSLCRVHVTFEPDTSKSDLLATVPPRPDTHVYKLDTTSQVCNIPCLLLLSLSSKHSTMY